MPLSPSELDLTQAIDASARQFLGERAYNGAQGTVALHELKRQLLQVVLPTLPYIVSQTGAHAFREGVEEGILGVPMDGPSPFSPEFKTPYDDVVIPALLDGVSA